MKRRLLTLLTLVALMGAMSGCASQKSPLSFLSSKRSVTKKSEKKETEYERLHRIATDKATGMMTLLVAEGRIYFELPINLLGREMLIGSTVSKISDNAHAVVGSKPTPPLHVKFTMNAGNVQLRQVSTEYTSVNSNIDKALEKSMLSAILQNTKVLAYSPDSSSVLFEMTKFFREDNKLMSPFDRNTVYASFNLKETFKKDNSYISKVRAYEDNVSITSVLSYTYSLSASNGRPVVSNAPLTAHMTRSIVLLPEKPYRPRLADYRIGVFFTVRNQLGEGTRTSSPVYYANRWDLQPQDTIAYRRGELTPPVKPITFYIDDTFPESWKPYIKEGVLQWNELFESIGFKNAVVAREFPKDDPTFDPDNIKYSCLRYAPINIKNAMGPSWVDPRSGEILTASVYVYHDVVKLIRDWLFTQTAQADERVRSGEIPPEVMGDALRYVISHEIGHCLGFMHNMGASHTVPVDSLRSPSYTQAYGTTPSIMDYARFNYVAQPGDKERGVKLTPPRFGRYDRYLVEWTYRPVFEATTAEEESKVTAQWISDALRKADYYRYGKQQFKENIDPRALSEDLSDDAIKASQYGIQNLKYIVKNLNEWVRPNDKDLRLRSELYIEAINQLALYIIHIHANVSGCYINEVKEGDNMPRYATLSPDYQRKALRTLFSIYDDLSWIDDAPLRQQMAISGKPSSAIRTFMNRLILPLPISVSLYEEMAPNSFTSTEAFDMIFDFVWNSTRPLSADRRQLQKSYLSEMAKAGEFSGKSTIRLLAGETPAFIPQRQSLCSHGSVHGYAPVSGFEWVQETKFATPKATPAVIYAYLMKAKKVIEKRIKTTSGTEQAHYQVLLNSINEILK